MPIIEFFLTVLCIYYVGRAVLRVLLPFLFRGLVNKAQQQGNVHYYQYTSNNKSKAQSKVNVDYAPKKQSAIPDSEGDFIDYEEIK